VRLAGGQKTQHSAFILSEKIAASVERTTDLPSDPCGPSSCTVVSPIDSATKENAMQLVADRFAVLDGECGRACDLATGGTVVLVVGSAGGVSDEMRWTDRCSALRALHHHSIAPLVDFGLLGEASRFEAWSCGPTWAGAAEVSASTRDRVKHFLYAAGMSAGPLAPECLRVSNDGTALVLPEAGTGYPGEADAEADVAETPLQARGLDIIERRGISALSEMFHGVDGTRPHVAALWGPPGSGKRMAVREIARIARMHGFVPVASRLVASRYAELWRGRSLFVIGDEEDSARWSAFLDVALRDAQPHVMLMVGNDECRSIDGVRLGRVPAEAMVSAIRPRLLNHNLERAARRAAERAQGLPGRFVRLLWPQSPAAHGAHRSGLRRGLSRVAERPALYGREDAADELLVAPVPACAWPAPGELTSLRRRRDAAVVHLTHGRHAPGLRQLRQAIGGLARRSDWANAADGALALAGALLRRGRARDALAAIDEGRQYARRAGRDGVLLDLATLDGEAWIDLGRLDEAERVVVTALAAARAASDPARAAAASVTLARCLYWRGQYAEAGAALGGPSHEMARVRHALLAARIAVGLRDVSRAMSLVLEAGEWASAAGPAGSKAAVNFTAAFVHLAVGDLDAVERAVSESIAAARAAHDPLRAIRARLIRAEAERRRGRNAAAVVQLQRLRRVMATMPPALRARWELCAALARGDGDPQEVVARRVAATGLGALALYASDPRVLPGSSLVIDPFVDELVAIVRVCQAAEEETVVLKDVCVRVRQHLRAAAVAFVAVLGRRAEIVCGDGVRLDTAIAERAAEAGITIAPHRRDDRIEAAAPVQYGGRPIGALCARWTLGTTDDTSRAASVLTMSAAAAAPMLAATIARREQMVVEGASELLGVTPAMAELRSSVERAAAAPFAVLIDGESGSGKELVARAIHRGGSRRHRAFCTLNCAALPDDLVEAELFGHARGAFTGAVGDRAGVFEEAHGGTLFLDEIGELAARAQAKVLRVLQEGELRRVGENVSRRVDVRIVAATNRDLRREVDAGRFRLDLLYRLDVVHITVPPLRDRCEDIAVLAEHFWREAAARVGSRASLSSTTIAALARYDWPGNVRELQNVLAALAVRCPRRGVVPPSALPPPFGAAAGGVASRLEEARRTFEERFVRAALVRTGGHRGRAAAELGVTRQGLTKLMTRLGISA
jgi:DNA-binding NtrC family response regulator/tetratricopeptide (TPR) repeat protein